MLAPKTIMYCASGQLGTRQSMQKAQTVKKNATQADDAAFVPILNRTEIISIERPTKEQPQNIVIRRPILSRKRLGKSDPSMSDILMLGNHVLAICHGELYISLTSHLRSELVLVSSQRFGREQLE